MPGTQVRLSAQEEFTLKRRRHKIKQHEVITRARERGLRGVLQPQLSDWELGKTEARVLPAYKEQALQAALDELIAEQQAAGGGSETAV